RRYCRRPPLVPCFWAGNYRPVIYHLPGCLRRIAPASQKDRLLAICTGIYCRGCRCRTGAQRQTMTTAQHETGWQDREVGVGPWEGERSEEHTSELQSRFDLVCRLMLEKNQTKTR